MHTDLALRPTLIDFSLEVKLTTLLYIRPLVIRSQEHIIFAAKAVRLLLSATQALSPSKSQYITDTV